MTYTVIKGNLLDADTEYIVQQTCCTAVKASGLSQAIANKWPEINPYSDRKAFKGNWAVVEDRAKPGSILVYNFEEPNPNTIKGVICAFAQYCHGKPGGYKDPLNINIDDTADDRIKYFIKSLKCIKKLNPKSIGFPYKIGCGLAGGSWPVYEKILKNWSLENPNITIKVYKLD